LRGDVAAFRQTSQLRELEIATNTADMDKAIRNLDAQIAARFLDATAERAQVLSRMQLTLTRLDRSMRDMQSDLRLHLDTVAKGFVGRLDSLEARVRPPTTVRNR
jgi:hypothetical protein